MGSILGFRAHGRYSAFRPIHFANNKIELVYQSAGTPGTNTIGFSMTVVPGLYATLLELRHGIANAAIAAQVHKSNPRELGRGQLVPARLPSHWFFAHVGAGAISLFLNP